jgi:hypothetical protein
MHENINKQLTKREKLTNLELSVAVYIYIYTVHYILSHNIMHNHLRIIENGEIAKLQSLTSRLLRHGINAAQHAFILFYFILFYFILLYFTLLYFTLHYITLHYITLHYITLHYITLHYITLHYTPPIQKGF